MRGSPMSCKIDQCKQDAHVMAETCRILSSALNPLERACFFSTLVNELVHDRDDALQFTQFHQPAA
jgi:hypothetical protein